MPAPHAQKIGMVSSMIPESRELYVPREISALREAGFPVRVYSIFQPNREIQQPEFESLRAEAVVSNPWAVTTWLGAVAHLVRHPLLVLGLLGELCAAGWRSPEQLLKTLLLFPAACRLARDAKHHGVTHIHAQWANVSSTTGYAVARLAGVPFSFSIHGESIFHPRPCGLLALKCRRAAWVASCNSAAVDYVLSHHLLPPERIAVIHHGVDQTRFSPTTPQKTTPSEHAPFRLVTVGRLERSKGLPTLIDAIDLLRKRGRNIHLEIIGSGPYETRLRNQIAQQALNANITMTPYLPQAELPGRYHAADAMVLSAVTEHHWGIPNAVLESMACGVPVVATELPSMRNFFVQDETFLASKDGDAASVASQIERLMDSQALVETLRRNGPLFIRKHFDWGHNLAAFVASFQSMEQR